VTAGGERRDLRFVRAEVGDLEVIVEVREEAAVWLAGKGIEQWPVGLFRQLVGRLVEHIAAGQEYLVYAGAELAGTLRLQDRDDEMWSEIADRAALYLHGFAVRRHFAGRGFGLRMLGWAENHAAAAGKAFLRLDCVAHNDRLIRYYEEAGFSRQGTVESLWGGGSSLHQRFEKRAAR